MLSALPALGAAAAAALALTWWAAARPAPEELAALLPPEPESRHVQAVEREWIDDAFELRWIPAPPASPPCPDGVRTVPGPLRNAVAGALAGGTSPDALARLGALAREHRESWLPALAYAVRLIEAGRLADAERVLDAQLEGGAGAALEARVRTRRDRGWAQPREEVLAAIHLLHAAGYARLARHRTDPSLWPALKNPIGYAKLVADGPTWIRGRLPAPGCGEEEGRSLSTYDLYNNLIVGYVDPGGFTGSAAARARELHRRYDDPPEANPLQEVMQAMLAEPEGEPAPERESWLWAVSNAERLLRERLWGTAAPPDPLLALNLAQLYESARPLARDEALAPLAAGQAELVAAARAARDRVPETARPEFERALVPLELAAAVTAGRPPAIPEEAAAALGPAERETVEAMRSALRLRAEPAVWVAVVTGEKDDEEAAAAIETLGARRRAWRSASRSDFAASLARQVVGGPEELRRDVARRAETLLLPGDERPAALDEIEEGLGLGWRLAPRVLLTSGWAAVLLAALAAAAGGALGWWIATVARLRRSLFTSYYRLEAAERLRGAR